MVSKLLVLARLSASFNASAALRAAGVWQWRVAH
jgi:hypothetical protein